MIMPVLVPAAEGRSSRRQLRRVASCRVVGTERGCSVSRGTHLPGGSVLVVVFGSRRQNANGVHHVVSPHALVPPSTTKVPT
jgi:hypothetical protein